VHLIDVFVKLTLRFLFVKKGINAGSTLGRSERQEIRKSTAMRAAEKKVGRRKEKKKGGEGKDG